jgi:hypothetical protein
MKKLMSKNLVALSLKAVIFGVDLCVTIVF